MSATTIHPLVAPARPAAPRVEALAPGDRATAWRRRLGAIAVLVVVAFAITVAIGRVTAGADLAEPVAGHHVVQPGESLWQIAAASAPAGTDVRDQLSRIVALNGFDGSAVQPWDVVLLPVR